MASSHCCSHAHSQLDFSTQAKPNHVRTTHSDIVLDVNFDTKQLIGHVSWKWERVGTGEEANQLILDTKDLTVTSVVNEKDEKVAWSLGDAHAVFGQALKIDISSFATKQGTVKIEYSTSPSASALQWLEPAQTGGKVLPFLFSQCQAIHARSMIPCQDTPMVKSTYAATVTVPATMTALFSALGNGNDPVSKTDTTKTFKFNQPVAAAAYLIALAVGDLGYEKVGPRTGVWAEPAVVKAAAFEFSEMEQMVSAGEQVCGPYVWGVYDVLVMPPSFPYGGMENPCLTFVTPTLLAGDRSLATVVIHEITHSWTGNLVTNQSWEHFWLNEGWTMFVQRKIMEILKGTAAAELDAIGGLKALSDSVNAYGHDHKFTALKPDLSGGVDPDDAFSSVPYEKGFNFITYLQQVAGGKETFKPFVLAYVKNFAYKTLTSEDFKQFYIGYFTAKGTNLDSIDWDTWFNSPGMPPVANKFDDSLKQASDALTVKWIEGKGKDCATDDIANFIPAQLINFLNSLEATTQAVTDVMTDSAVLDKMDALYKFSESGNNEIKFRWQKICIGAERASILPSVVAFVTSAGRMKYVRPLYKALFASKMGKELAVKTFTENISFYHPIAKKMLEKDLAL